MRALALGLLLETILLADGGMVSSGWIEERGQVAIIKHFDDTETLLLSTSFYAYADNFAWFVPLPAEPAVDSVDGAIFDHVKYLSRPAYRRAGAFGCAAAVPVGGEAHGGKSWGGEGEPIEEVRKGTIGHLDYQVLATTSAGEFIDYLEEHDYSVPRDAPEVLQYYLDKGWNYFFVAHASELADRREDVSVGVSLTFPSRLRWFPLYISRLSSDEVPVVIYALTEHRQTFTDSELRFSGRVDPGAFADFPGFLDRPCHLTKLVRYFYWEDMRDFFLTIAPDDHEYREVIYEGGTDLSVLLWPLTFAGVLALRRRRGPSHRAQLQKE